VNPDVVVAFVALAIIGGLVLLGAGIRGTTGPARPASATTLRLTAWARGTGLTAAQRRTRYVMLLATAGVTVMGWLVTRVPGAALLAGGAVLAVPWMFNVDRSERQAIERLEALGEWIHRLRDNLGTGTGLRAALVSSAATAPPQIAAEAARLAVDLQDGIISADVALRRFADALSDPTADRVVATLLLHLSDHGERLSDVLSNRADRVAKEVTMRREIHGERKQSRTDIRFMTVYSLAAFAILLLSPDLASAFRVPAGQVVLLVIVGGFAGVLFWVRALCSPRRDPRLLTPLPDREA